MSELLAGMLFGTVATLASVAFWAVVWVRGTRHLVRWWFDLEGLTPAQFADVLNEVEMSRPPTWRGGWTAADVLCLVEDPR